MTTTDPVTFLFEATRPGVLIVARQLRGVITELAALRWVWENTPELRDDRVARREVSLRITEAEQLLLRDLAGLTDPRLEPIGSGCLWFHAGLRQKVSSLADVSQLLSKILDLVYHQAPKIRNELIVRRTLSTAAAAARRNLIEAMLKCEAKPLLGMEGFPPERSIYESVLRAIDASFNCERAISIGLGGDAVSLNAKEMSSAEAVK